MVVRHKEVGRKERKRSKRIHSVKRREDRERRKRERRARNSTKNRHHRLPRSRGGKNDRRNISIVGIADHEAWHRLFDNHLPPVVCKIINDTWIQEDVKLIPVPINQVEEVKRLLGILEQ